MIFPDTQDSIPLLQKTIPPVTKALEMASTVASILPFKVVFSHIELQLCEGAFSTISATYIHSTPARKAQWAE